MINNKEKKIIKIAIFGQPNCGKSAIFKLLTNNKITKISNYPRTTLNKVEGINDDYNKNYKLIFLDLPGIYSTKAYSHDERIAINEILETKPDLILCVLDPVTIYRGLNLAIQLIETGIKTIICINMIDEIVYKKIKINTNELSTILNTNIISCNTKRQKEKNKILSAIIKKYKQLLKVENNNHTIIKYDQLIENNITKISNLIEKKDIKYNKRWISIKYIEQDEYIISKINNQIDSIKDKINKIVNELQNHTKEKFNKSTCDIIYESRNNNITKILKSNIINKPEKLDRTISEKIDKIFIHGFMGPISIIFTIYIMFMLTFKLGSYPKIIIQQSFSKLGLIISEYISNETLRSLLLSGIIDGVGSIIGFIPLIFIVFFILGILDELGYTSRMVYVLDRISRLFGLHGTSVMPYIISGGIPGGCAIPGIMSAGIIRNKNEKLATILTAPFMICGAKITIFIMIAEIFFYNHAATMMLILTIISWIIPLCIAKIFRLTILKGESSYLIMELPPYRIPNLYILFIRSLYKIIAFIKKAGTVILISSIFMWFIMTFPKLPEEQINNQKFQSQQYENMTQQEYNQITKNIKMKALKHSIAGKIGTVLEPIGNLAGFPWQLNIALVGGIVAKEIIISTLSTSYSIGELNLNENESTKAKKISNLKNKIINDKSFNLTTAVSLLIFVLIYAPCTSSILLIARESSWKLAISYFIISTIMAYLISVIIYQFCNIII